MAARLVRLDIPEVNLSSLSLLPGELRELGDLMSAPGSSARNTLREAARIVEAVRLAMIVQDAEDEDLKSMTEGEVAIIRNLKAISGKLDVLIRPPRNGN